MLYLLFSIVCYCIFYIVWTRQVWLKKYLATKTLTYLYRGRSSKQTLTDLEQTPRRLKTFWLTLRESLHKQHEIFSTGWFQHEDFNYKLYFCRYADKRWIKKTRMEDWDSYSLLVCILLGSQFIHWSIGIKSDQRNVAS